MVRRCLVARKGGPGSDEKRLLLLQRDFHASDAKVQPGTLAVGRDLYDDALRILEIPYSAATNESGTGGGNGIGAREIVRIVEFVHFTGYDVRAAADVRQGQSGSGK